MREKLLDLMKSEGLKPSQLAEMLGINPAGVSHILAGRNKPGFDLLQKILRRFPRVNPDWLLLDSTQMYRNDSAGTPDPTPAPALDFPIGEGLFGLETAGTVPPKTTRPETMDSETSAQPVAAPFPVSSRTGATVRRVVLFYDDDTFESYTPTKR